MKNTIGIALAMTLLTGCAVTSVGMTGSSGNATLSVTPDVSNGSYQSQAILNAYSSADIEHVLIRLYTVSGGVETLVLDGSSNPVQKDVASGSIANAIVFGNLASQTTYRIRAFAYKSPGTAAGDLISTVDASSSVDVVLTNNDRPTLATLPVKLIDRVFDGQATASGIVVASGSVNAPAVASISLIP